MDRFVVWAYIMAGVTLVPIVHGVFLVVDPVDVNIEARNQTAFLIAMILAEPIIYGLTGIFLGWKGHERGSPDGKPSALLCGLAVLGSIPIRFFLTGLVYDWF